VLNGYNATVFAYDLTGSGKSFTMLGDKDRNVLGVSALIIEDIFSLISNNNKNSFQLIVSYLKITTKISETSRLVG